MQDVVGQIVAGGESLWQSVDIQTVSMTLHKATEVATKTAGGCMRDWSAMLAIGWHSLAIQLLWRVREGLVCYACDWLAFTCNPAALEGA